jgi:hypothetical protein
MAARPLPGPCPFCQRPSGLVNRGCLLTHTHFGQHGPGRSPASGLPTAIVGGADGLLCSRPLVPANARGPRQAFTRMLAFERSSRGFASPIFTHTRPTSARGEAP